MSAPSNAVLYFPSIEFHDDAWVKASLILWDHIYRIVPPDFTPSDSDEIKAAIDSGAVRNITLDDDERSEALLEYNRFIDSRPFLPHGIQAATESHLLHPNKVDARLYPRLAEQARHVFADGRLELPAGIARGYMYFLSQIVARRRNLNRGTDDRDSWAIASYFSEQGNFSEQVYALDAGAYYTSLAIDDLLPTNVRSAPMSEILTFASRSETERREFRLSLHALTESIGRVEDAEHRRQVIEDYIKAFERNAEELRKATKHLCRQNTLRSALIVGLPTTTSALWAMGMGQERDPYIWWRLGINLAISAMAAYADAKLVTRRNRHPSAEAYLVDLDEKMAKEKRFPAFEQAFEEFMND